MPCIAGTVSARLTDAAQAELEALRAALAAAEARAAALEAKASNDTALSACLKLEIEKLRRALFGTGSERKARLLDQLELQLEELEASASEDDPVAELVAANSASAG